MKAKHYKKARALHKTADIKWLKLSKRLGNVEFARVVCVKAAHWHRAKAHENHLKWYGAFTEGWKFGADADQIRKDHNYPEFNPKTAGGNEPDEQVFTFDALTPGARIVALTANAGYIDEGIN